MYGNIKSRALPYPAGPSLSDFIGGPKGGGRKGVPLISP